MRVIAGEFRSRRLKTLPGLELRPTPDRLREALFNILAPRIVGAVFVDAYAGAGAVGIEALSRGAARAFFIERSRPASAVIHANLSSLGLEKRVEVFTGKVQTVLPRLTADIIFADPPYLLDAEYGVLLRVLSAHPPPLALIQHHRKRTLPPSAGPIERYRVLSQGENCVSFYRRAGEA